MITVRKATREDINILFEWTNDPITRAESFNQNKIEYNEHVQWLDRKLSDPNALILICRKDGTRIGVVRFDKRESSSIVSISLGNQYRGRGIGVQMLEQAIDYVKNINFCSYLIAYIKTGNIASRNIFAKNGFECVDNSQVESFPESYKFIKKLDEA